MFRSFFLAKRWLHWSIAGSILILATTWFLVQLDVRINEWFGEFYDLIQTALANPGNVEFNEFLAHCLTFAKIAAVYILTSVILGFFVRHFVFRWRIAMNDYYVERWERLRHIEGAAQRIQEDTMRFASTMEHLGVRLMDSLMTLVAFLPLLWVLSEHVTELPWIGPVAHSLVFLALVFSAGGTVLLAVVGIKLPGLEFDIQKVEAAYRKELVLGEDRVDHARPPTLKELFEHVRTTYFIYYLHYLYFDIAKYSYLQVGVIVPYVAMGPTIVAGGITLGLLQQILRAHGRVESSFQFLVHSWHIIVELISIYKRLKAFESQIAIDPRPPEGALT